MLIVCLLLLDCCYWLHGNHLFISGYVFRLSFINLQAAKSSTTLTDQMVILISNFRRVLNAVLYLLANLSASELFVPTFRNLLAVPSS